MILNKAQLNLHWNLWKQVKAIRLRGRETWTQLEEDRERHAIYREALDFEISLTQVNNDHFDKILAAFKAIIEPGNLNAQIHALNGQRKRLLYRIRQLCPDRSYLAGIVRKMNQEGNLGSELVDDLSPADLKKVLIALRKHEARQPAEPQPF